MKSPPVLGIIQPGEYYRFRVGRLERIKRRDAFHDATPVARLLAGNPPRLNLTSEAPGQRTFWSAVGDRKRREVDDVAAHILNDADWSYSTRGASVNPVGQHDDDKVAFRIDPHRCPGEAGMPEGARRQILTAASISWTCLPSESAPLRTRPRKRASNAVGEESRAPCDSSIEHELSEYGEVACRGEQTCMASHTA